MSFPTSYKEILERIDAADPVAYARTRNFENGKVTRLSPYISRGVISTKLVLEKILAKGYDPRKIEKFIQELAWRDYWQQTWVTLGDGINQDLKQKQLDVSNHGIAEAIDATNTGIDAIDRSIFELKQTGYMHNHMRMYVAALACNIGKSHWKSPAHWMYYHLLDGDWASNGLSWQWVAGANASKKYIANQENINKYFNSNQRDTFLDLPYPELAKRDIPDQLRTVTQPSFVSVLPSPEPITIETEKPTLVYNYYNLDPEWRKDEDVNRIFLLEPSVFQRFPVSPKCIDFALELSKNIPNIKVFVGEFDQLQLLTKGGQIIFKEHPLNANYNGIEDERDWMFGVKGYYRSFFAFWKKCQKEMKQW